jgi:hypothetical protein
MTSENLDDKSVFLIILSLEELFCPPGLTRQMTVSVFYGLCVRVTQKGCPRGVSKPWPSR